MAMAFLSTSILICWWLNCSCNLWPRLGRGSEPLFSLCSPDSFGTIYSGFTAVLVTAEHGAARGEPIRLKTHALC